MGLGPMPIVGWGVEYPSPFLSPSTPAASRTRHLRRLGSQSPLTKVPGSASVLRHGCFKLDGDARIAHGTGPLVRRYAVPKVHYSEGPMCTGV